MQESNHHGNFHFFSFNFFTKKLRSPSYHQTTYKHSKNDKYIKIQKSNTNTTIETVNHHSQKREHTCKRRHAVVHCVYRTVTGTCSVYCPISRGSSTEADFFSFHATHVLCNPHFLNFRIAVQLVIDRR